VEDLDAAGAHHDLVGRRRVTVDLADLLGQRLAQRHDPRVGRVLGVAVARRAGGRLDDVGRVGKPGSPTSRWIASGRRQASSITSRIA
jgi:hypothetical protein